MDGRTIRHLRTLDILRVDIGGFCRINLFDVNGRWVASMNSALLEEELIRDEGKRNKVYNDSCGIATIGIGRNLRDRGLSDEEISFLFKNDLLQVEQDCDNALPWWRDLSDARQRVLANMCFNLGLTRLLEFKKFLAALKEHRYRDASLEMLNSKWARQVPKRALRLSKMIMNGE